MTNCMRDRLLTSSILAGALSVAAPAVAQNTATTPAPATGQDASPDIIVTGSLIRNANLTSASPVQAVSSAEIRLQQTTNAEQLLRTIPGVVANIGSNVNNGNGGASYVDLRGLGANRNLVLLDGARVTPAGTAGQTDLNNIPVALIERVDSLTGGASTTYGADAVSGVINFITKKNFSGVDLMAREGISERGDTNIFSTALTIGGNFAENRGNAVLSLSYDKADALYYGARDFSVFSVNSKTGVASGASSVSSPTTFAFDNPNNIALFNNNLQVDSTGKTLIPAYLPFNFNPYNLLSLPLKKVSGYAAANYEVSDAVEFYARGMFSRNTVTTIVAPSGLFGDSVTIPGNNPFLTPAIRDLLCTGEGIALGAACINNPAIPLGGVYRRAVEVGPRTDQYKTDYYDVRAGFRFNITHSIKADIYGAYGESTNTQTRLNYTSLTRIQQALNATSTTACTNTANSCVPLDLIGQITPAMAAFIGGVTSTIQRSTSLGQVHGVVSGDFGWTLPGASKPVSFAVGGEYRRYKASVAPDSLAQVPGELGGAGGAVKPVSGAYDVKEGFGELNIPLVSHKPFFDELTAEAGARYSSYKNFNTWTYKGGLTWAPDPALKFRGNYQRAVRAPNIAELFAPSVTGLTNLAVDPCAGSAPTTNANLAAICLAQGAPAGRVAAGTIPQPNAGQANQYGGGNLNLKPEVSDSFTVGFVAQPKNLVSGLSLTVDFFNIIVNNAITTPTPGDVIAACFNNITAASATSAACTGILRNPSTGALSGSSANTPGLPQPLSNLGRIATDGIDFSANYQHNLGFAKLDASLTGTWTDHSKFKATPSAINRECVGQYSTDCGFNAGAIQPKFVWNQRTTLKFDGVDLSLLWRHLGPANYEYIKTALFSGTIKNGPGTAAPAYSPLGGTTANFNHISPYDYFDLSAKFEIAKKIEITMTAFNLFDKQPPLVGATAGSTAQNSGNTFPSTYDPIGRRYAVSARLKF